MRASTSRVPLLRSDSALAVVGHELGLLNFVFPWESFHDVCTLASLGFLRAGICVELFAVDEGSI